MSQSLRESGQFLLAGRCQQRPPLRSRNPFVNQVSFFDFYADSTWENLFGGSQSLRESGQFLWLQPKFEMLIRNWGRNPFVNQVSFFPDRKPQGILKGPCRNPFVNQVSFFEIGKEYETDEAVASQSLRESGQFLCHYLHTMCGNSLSSQSLRESGQFLFIEKIENAKKDYVAIPS